jgi:hypothetical protein
MKWRLADPHAHSGLDLQSSRDVKHLDTKQGQDTDRPRFGCVSRLADGMSIFALARTWRTGLPLSKID